MSLDKTAERRKKIQEANRLLRVNGVIPLTARGPWYPIQYDLQFDPSFYKGFFEQETGIDTPPAK
jgi:hypothetical protein